ncbi:uncharacterized protein LOC143885533 [Tasmannia lanceolata]|uniref:uncharacterized protein LOC143885533 n=1 Tax=Tasmannia lanceolata TaxID=3420 RepID=UPI00406283ED
MRGLHAYSIVGVLWFVSVCCCFYKGQACLEEERKALLQLKDSINDYPNNATYPVLEDWVGEDCCQWGGVSCSTSSSHVIGIHLSNARDPSLGVWYPNATLFAQFKELESLDLTYNQIGGWVMPEGLCSLKRLKQLDLPDNQLDDRSLPSCLGNLSSLEDLDISDNNLRNPIGISTGLCGLKRLTQLDLSINNLHDQSLASCLGNLSSLQNLHLSGNNLTFTFGDISTGLCGLKRLTNLYLGNNNLDDQSLASCLGNLSSLQTLDLSWNNLTFTSGAISTGLCSLKRLKTLDLRVNQLDDRSFPSCLGNLSSLEHLSLSDNNLRNPIGMSTGLCGLKRLTNLYLGNNNLDDQSLASCLGNLSSLQTLDLSWNNLTFTSGAISTGTGQ